MPKYELTENEFQQIPEGEVVNAEVISVDEKVMPFKDKETGKEVVRIEFKFAVKDDQYPERNIWGTTSTNFTDNPDCKLRAWAQEIMGLDQIPKGFQLDTDQLLGLSCRVVVGHRSYEDKNGKTQTRDFATDVIRAKRGPAPEVF